MKHLPSIIVALICTAFAGIVIVHAQSYTPLAPLPGTFTETAAGVKTTTMSQYLSGGIKLLIALGAALAVLYAIIGGTQYVAASINPSAKKDALERVWNALIGLAIILTSYLLLNSINPKLVDVKFELEPVTPRAIAVTPQVAVVSKYWNDDTAVRNELSKANVKVKSPSCNEINQLGCASVYGLGRNAITGLRGLDNSCAAFSGRVCDITVVGGTEYWLHSQNTNHRPGNSVVDLRMNNDLDAKIRSGASLGTQPQCSSLGPAFRLSGLGGGMYVDEPTLDRSGAVVGRHWHVCY